jgi:hypothetical protein
MIRLGATSRDAPQSMHAISMYQSPGAESGLRMGFTSYDLLYQLRKQPPQHSTGT